MRVLDELGERSAKPRLIPLFKQPERRLLSVFMSLLEICPTVRGYFLSKCGYGSGKTCKLTSRMEVSFASPKLAGVRPDGLLVCQRGKSNWSAFIEAKAEASPIRSEQIQDYAQLASVLDVDAVITISNEFATTAEQLPYHISHSRRKKRDIYHFSWADIRTMLERIKSNEVIENTELLVLDECLEFFWSEGSGVRTYDAMPVRWPDFVQSAGVPLGFSTKTQGITEIIHGWQQERRDLSSKLAHLSQASVHMVHAAGVRSKPEDRLAHDRKMLADLYVLEACYAFEHSKTRLSIQSDLKACRTSVALQIQPLAGKKAKGVVTWLITSLRDFELSNADISFDWKGQNMDRTLPLSDLVSYPEQAFMDRKEAPKNIRIVAGIQDVRRFKSRKKFIEDVEGLAISMLNNATKCGWL